MADKSFEVARLPGFGAVAVVVFLVLYVPIFTLVIYSFNAGTTITHWQGWSLKWYADAWENDAIQSAAIRSLVLATTAADAEVAAAAPVIEPGRSVSLEDPVPGTDSPKPGERHGG